MTKDKMREVVEDYRALFLHRGIESIDYPHDELVPVVDVHRFALGHCHGMLDKMLQFIEENRIEKFMRWLGFLQGVAWVLQVHTLNELKDQSRPDESK